MSLPQKGDTTDKVLYAIIVACVLAELAVAAMLAVFIAERV